MILKLPIFYILNFLLVLRIIFSEGCLNYVDLEQEDWLFQGDVKADIQFRVYRDMRAACRKNWAKFTPKVGLDCHC